MHYAILIRVIRHHGLGNLLDRPNGQVFRKMLAGIVLATDMNVHFEFMKNFGLLVTGKDYPLSRRKLLLCQALIKCADISNPVSLRYIIRSSFTHPYMPEPTAGSVTLLGECVDGGMELSSIAGKVVAIAALHTALGNSPSPSSRTDFLH